MSQQTSLIQKILLVTVSIFAAIVLLEAGLRVYGVILLSGGQHSQVATEEADVYRILCLGESTTKLGDNPSYPEDLEMILNERQLGRTFRVTNAGVPATNTTAILAQLEENLDRYQPHAVVTMMGINDYSDTPQQVLFANQISDSFLESLRVVKFFRLLKTQAARNLSVMFVASDQTWLKGWVKRRYTDRSLIELADDYIFQGEYDKALDVLLKAKEWYPESAQVYSELGWHYLYQNKYEPAQNMLIKAIELDPHTTEAYVVLGRHYRQQEDFLNAEKTLSAAVKMNSANTEARYELAKTYWDQKYYSAAEKVLQEAAEEEPLLAGPYGLLAVLYLEQDQSAQAEIFFSKAQQLRGMSVHPTTKTNYNALKDIVTSRGLQLICVQYPMRNVQDLTALFDKTEGVTFVDNENIFKDAVAGSSYWEYFRDLFATDFGHCTAKGNRLLAQNIADAIQARLSATNPSNP